ncbi:MAG: hypothetical protein ISS01_01615 [Nanoarchaeota archaeon]|nr:hypothetical protein [Nanoarchaeota archaeon]
MIWFKSFAEKEFLLELDSIVGKGMSRKYNAILCEKSSEDGKQQKFELHFLSLPKSGFKLQWSKPKSGGIFTVPKFNDKTKRKLSRKVHPSFITLGYATSVNGRGMKSAEDVLKFVRILRRNGLVIIL